MRHVLYLVLYTTTYYYCTSCTTHTGTLHFVRVRRKHAHTRSRGVSSVLALPTWRIVNQISHSYVRVGQVWRRWADMRFCRDTTEYHTA